MKNFFWRPSIKRKCDKEVEPLTIVSDAGVVSSGIAEGRLISHLIVDTTNRADIEELIRLHEHVPPGDVDVQWGQVSEYPDSVVLILWFKRPIQVAALLKFDILEQGIIVEQILISNLFCLQAGRPGDRIKSTLGAPSIYIEVHDTGFRPVWDKKFFKYISKEMKRRGFNRQQAKRAAKDVIEEIRSFGRLRAPGR
ncbi:hypothetical protein T8K17_01130 [Thalassobaculum sp. OXR-137]|uniref:hypothetical protein n=1 Tax=Thalassobaculum sp. OXR-137 TaxID=3100173 RepID=UPI002AC97214|nr:hypothetical protein [Thalassobaculum sp. OXR-137]WPZ34751.1 hypothetical protein T8K17_01130 [Thalassobaculum sp. OXR-137]